MEGDCIFDIEARTSQETVFGFYANKTALLTSDRETRLQVLEHLEAATDYLRKTLSPATE